MLTVERLRQVLDYDPATGVFTWKPRPAPAQWNTDNAGKTAGAVHNAGYWRIAVDDRSYLAHRLAWLYVYGRWPSKGMDHVNRDRSDNRIQNLREASKSDNGVNRGAQSNNKSGYRGVYFDRRRNKWYSEIRQKDKGRFCIGYFSNPEAAFDAYKAKAAELFSEFCPASFD